MRREQIVRRKLQGKRRLPEIPPLDPRDPDILRAKELTSTQVPSRRRSP
jgi:hypothetical protein